MHSLGNLENFFSTKSLMTIFSFFRELGKVACMLWVNSVTVLPIERLTLNTKSQNKTDVVEGLDRVGQWMLGRIKYEISHDKDWIASNKGTELINEVCDAGRTAVRLVS